MVCKAAKETSSLPTAAVYTCGSQRRSIQQHNFHPLQNHWLSTVARELIRFHAEQSETRRCGRNWNVHRKHPAVDATPSPAGEQLNPSRLESLHRVCQRICSCMHTNHSHRHAYKTPICKTESVSLTWVQRGLSWWPNLCLTAHQPRRDYMQRLSARRVPACPHKGYYRYSNRSLYFKMWLQLRLLILDGVDIVDSPSQTSHSTTGKSTWIQGWSSFIIPCMDRKWKTHCYSGFLATVLGIKEQVINRTSPEVSSSSESFSAWPSSSHF